MQPREPINDLVASVVSLRSTLHSERVEVASTFADDNLDVTVRSAREDAKSRSEAEGVLRGGIRRVGGYQRHELLESPRGKRHGRVDSIVPRGERHARELCAVQVIVFLNIAKPHQDASVGLAHIYE